MPESWGTAVNVQAMVFGNLGKDCATGVPWTEWLDGLMEGWGWAGWFDSFMALGARLVEMGGL